MSEADLPHRGARIWDASYPSLKDKRVLVTGGGSGIGEVIVESFVKQGAQVAFIDIERDASEELAARLSSSEHAPIFRTQNLADVEASQAVISEIETLWGGIDILVNNAANDDRHQIEDVTPAYWDDRMAVNLRHVFFCTQSVIGGMKKAGQGVVVNLGSIAWHLALPDITLYETAKAGIEGMTRAMARDLGGHGIRVNTIIPGGIRTPRQMALWHDEAEEARMLGQQCLKERVLPGDVTAMALFLASEDARMCTGHSYFVDAGWR